jgi:hypothetical protein
MSISLQTNQLLLKKAFREICLGYSPFTINGENLYFKHLTTFDKIRCDEFENKALNTAIRLGRKSEKELLDKAKSDGVWSDKDERRIVSYRKDISTMSKKKLESIWEDQIIQNQEAIDEYTKDLNDLLDRKSQLLKNSAESFSQQEYMINYIIESVYRDEGLKTQFWSNDEEKRHLDFKAISNYYNIYNMVFEKFSNTNIKKIAISNYLQDPLSVTSDPYFFFRKEACMLSDLQIKLIRYGNYYKDILAESYDAPEEDRDDPDLLEEWFILKRNRAHSAEYEKAKKGEQDMKNLSNMVF